MDSRTNSDDSSSRSDSQNWRARSPTPQSPPSSIFMEDDYDSSLDSFWHGNSRKRKQKTGESSASDPKSSSDDAPSDVGAHAPSDPMSTSDDDPHSNSKALSDSQTHSESQTHSDSNHTDTSNTFPFIPDSSDSDESAAEDGNSSSSEEDNNSHEEPHGESDSNESIASS